MLKSMTGFGRERRVIGDYDICVEIRSVNSRYFEFNAKIPRSCQFMEDKIKNLVKTSVTRGKVELFLSLSNVQGKEAAVTVNNLIVESYVNSLREAGKKFKLPDDLSLKDVLHMTDAFTISRPDEDEELLWNSVREVTESALKSFVEMREAEGEKMHADLLEKLSNVENMVNQVCEISPQNVENYRNRLFDKLSEILSDRNIPEERLLLEAGIFSEKTAVDEETVRLKSHFSQFRTMLDSSEPVGRKLDFLVQELNREVNTIGSKAQSLEITRIVVDAKSEIEKIREQIQNIE